MTNERLMTIIRELTHGASEIQTEEMDCMMQAIMAVKRVFVAGMAQKAVSMKAAVALITTNREGKLASMTNTMIRIPGVSKETPGDQK